MPTAVDRSPTEHGDCRNLVRIMSRLGEAKACNVSAILTADTGSRVAGGVTRPSTPCPTPPLKHAAICAYDTCRDLHVYMYRLNWCEDGRTFDEHRHGAADPQRGHRSGPVGR